MRSPRVGSTRPATCAFVAATTGTGVNWPSSQPSATTAHAPVATSRNETARFRGFTVTVDRTMPRIGVISGATIIAPITVAVESMTTPAVAITAASSSDRLSCARARDHRTGARRACERDRWQRSRASGSVRQAPVSIRQRARTPFRRPRGAPAPGPGFRLARRAAVSRARHSTRRFGPPSPRFPASPDTTSFSLWEFDACCASSLWRS